MSRVGKIVLISAGLAAYVLLIAVLTAHYKFPYRPLTLQRVAEVEARTPLRVDFRGPEPGAPLRYRIEGIDLSLALPGGDYPVHDFDQARIKLIPWGLPRGRAAAGFSLVAGDGRIEGRARYGLTGAHPVEIEVTRIDLPNFHAADPGGSGGIEGHLTGRIRISGENGVLPTGGGGRIMIESGRFVDLDIPQMPFPELAFNRIELEFELEDRGVTVQSLRLDGPEGFADLSGQIVNYRQPRLNLSGSVRLGSADAPLYSAQIHVGGSAAQPRVRVTQTR
jgi:type II secretion system protein N